MRKLNGRVAAITGAGSGIGRALAQLLAREGMNLALSDINAESLAAVAEEIRASGDGVTVTTDELDVADREAVHAWAEKVESDHGACHLIINNAGVAVASSLRSVSYEDFEWLMNINFWGVVHGTRAFLPILQRQEEGHIVNISSVFGIISVPLNGTYNAAKFAVRGFTEALRMELELDEIPIGVTCIHPGGIKTNIAASARVNADNLVKTREEMNANFLDKAKTTPEQCAEQILRGVKKNAPRVLVGFDARIIDWVQRLLPTGYQKLVRRVAGGEWKKH